MQILRVISILLTILFPVNLLALQVLAYDSNGNSVSTKADILNGRDKFLVRTASTTEIAQKNPDLFMGNDNNYYAIATIDDFIKSDLDKNKVLTANEVHKLGFKFAMRQPDNKLVISTLDDNGISYIKILTNDSGSRIEIVPEIGSTPIKVTPVEIDKF